jgi:hypothetical protein
MAGFTRENGDASQVTNLDSGSYVNSTAHFEATVGMPVQPAGPKLIFIDGDLGSDPTAQFGPHGAIEAVLKVVQQLTTVHMYQFNDDGKFLIGAYDCGTDLANWAGMGMSLQDEIQALGTVNGYSLAAATAVAGTFLN